MLPARLRVDTELKDATGRYAAERRPRYRLAPSRGLRSCDGPMGRCGCRHLEPAPVRAHLLHRLGRTAGDPRRQPRPPSGTPQARPPQRPGHPPRPPGQAAHRRQARPARTGPVADALRDRRPRTWAASAGTSSSASRPPPRSPPTQTPQHDAGLADQARITPHHRKSAVGSLDFPRLLPGPPGADRSAVAVPSRRLRVAPESGQRAGDLVINHLG
jgi:hypothetical protein